MKARDAINLASQLLHNLLANEIRSSNKDPYSYRLKIELINGILLFIRYNNYGEYSYVIQFSRIKYDRIRFDNYDPIWNVGTKPHHMHLRGSSDVEESPMIGDPNQDMKELTEYLN